MRANRRRVLGAVVLLAKENEAPTIAAQACAVPVAVICHRVVVVRQRGVAVRQWVVVTHQRVVAVRRQVVVVSQEL